MPLSPTLIERILFQSTNQAPGPLLDLLGTLGFQAVLAALRLGIFPALSERPQDTAALASSLELDERGTSVLLAALEPLGYVAREGDGAPWRITEMTRRWILDPKGPQLGDLFAYFDDMAARWAQLPEAIRSGKPALSLEDWYAQRPGGWRVYHAGMRAVARLLAPEVLSRLRLARPPERLLDLGGSHGLFSARLCQKYPQLSATIYDHEGAREIARETAQAEGVDDRCFFVAGDFVTQEIEPGFDLVLCCSVARTLPADVFRAVLGKVARAMTFGGTLVVLDQLEAHPSSALRRANARLIELELFSASPGTVHSVEELSSWMTEAGFSVPRHVRLRRAGGQELLIAQLASR